LLRGTIIKYFLKFLKFFCANNLAEEPLEAQVMVFLLIYKQPRTS